MINQIKSKIKKNKSLLRVYEFFFQRPIKNYFNTTFNKKVALIYSTYHFSTAGKFGHTNNQESHVIADILNKLGYVVDIYNNNRTYDVCFDEYDLFFGEGDLIYDALLARTTSNNYKVIYYGTGSHPAFNNQSSLNAIQRYRKSTGELNLNYSRLVDQRWGVAATLADSCIVIGNKVTEKSFLDNSQLNCKMILPSVHKVLEFKKIRETRDLSKARKGVLHFSSYGLVHKGIDLILNAAKSHPELDFHICGKIEQELPSSSYLYKELSKLGNIYIHGFVDISSEQFQHLMNACIFSILPSCAEGCSTAVVTSMLNGGVIPIVSKQCGVDVDDFGFYLDELDSASINKIIETLHAMTDEELYVKSELAYKSATKYTIENFQVSTYQALLSLIQD
jgi:glycosyltransferase involved in cell wall biosynthesis